jgi:serine/threonine-protein kinase
MAAPHGIDRQTFLDHLRQSGLVGEQELARIAGRYARLPRGRSVARRLVAKGVLTRFQAERLLAGRTTGFLLGQYRILEPIGKGGMGRVYKARHRTMDRVVALKVLAPDLVANERALGLFLREVRAVARLIHPNVVTAFDADEAHGRHYLVLEYVDGPNLEELVRKQGRLPVGLACDYVKQAAHGLQAAHALGMVHRDIKPANLLVQRQGPPGEAGPGLVKVSDFGLARLGDPPPGEVGRRAGTLFTKDNTVMGTPDYLSPEQARNLHTTDIRSDVYSLGCTLYFLLTGRVPFPGGSALDKLIRQATERPVPVPDIRADVPAGVLAVLEKMVAKDPADRYQTPAELAEALVPFAVSGPTPWAKPPSAPFLETPPAARGGETGEYAEPDSDAAMPTWNNTVAGDGSPTLRPADPPAPRPARRAARPQERKLPAAVWLAAAGAAVLVAAGLLAAGGLLLWLFLSPTNALGVAG